LNAQIAGGNYESYTLNLVSDNPPQTLNSPIPSLILDPRCILGGVGIVYHCQNELIVKFSLSTKMARNQLTHEVSVYKHLTKQPHHANVPTFYGLFRCSTGLAMVISDEGRPFSSFQCLSTKQRYVIMSPVSSLIDWVCQSNALLESLVNVHQNGVLHGDFVPRNVVSKGEQPVIVDFSHAQLNHKCPGRLLCKELVMAERLLTHVPDDRCVVGVKGPLVAESCDAWNCDSQSVYA
jgi:serine/threonine protein kinase